MNNPPEWPGLAHFCEHMLFLGTSSFPSEGEFETYISVRNAPPHAIEALHAPASLARTSHLPPHPNLENRANGFDNEVASLVASRVSGYWSGNML